MTIYTSTGSRVQPGDFAAVCIEGPMVDDLIRFGEWVALRASRFSRHVPRGGENWTHAIFYAGEDKILEAEPHGAKFVDMHYQPAQCLWSTDNPRLQLTNLQRVTAWSIARDYEGTPYSFLDYEAIALHSLHVPAPGLKRYIASTGHMICSQVVDQCRLELGSHLFNDNRWPGYVDPLDLALLIQEA